MSHKHQSGYHESRKQRFLAGCCRRPASTGLHSLLVGVDVPRVLVKCTHARATAVWTGGRNSSDNLRASMAVVFGCPPPYWFLACVVHTLQLVPSV